MSWSQRSTAARIVSSSRSASMMIMTSYGRVADAGMACTSFGPQHHGCGPLVRLRRKRLRGRFFGCEPEKATRSFRRAYRQGRYTEGATTTAFARMAPATEASELGNTRTQPAAARRRGNPFEGIAVAALGRVRRTRCVGAVGARVHSRD